MMRKFIIREDTMKRVQEALSIYIEHIDEDFAEDNKRISSRWAKGVLHDFDTGLCTLSPYMPDHIGLGNKDCCGIFMGIDDKNMVICNECRMSLNDAIEQLKEGGKNG